MRVAIAKLKSESPYSQSRHIDEQAGDNVDKNQFEQLNWRKRMHVTEDGFVQMPPMAFKNAASQAARYLNIGIKGRGKATYTKHFEAGVLCMKPLVLPIKAESVAPEVLFVPSDGKPGGGKRVKKWFPYIPSWEGEFEFVVVDPIITEEVFERVLTAAGQFIGVGRFRPVSRGWYGRFSVEGITWSEMT